MIAWGNGQHKVVVGMTGTGKTFTTTRTLAAAKQGVLFFNTMRVPLPGFVKATGANEISDLMDEIESGGKVNFLPSTDLPVAQKQLRAIINRLYDRQWKDFIFIVDEAHLFCQEIKTKYAMRRAVTTGRNQGVEFVSLTQRLALLDNTLFTQAPYKVLFLLENETKYCEGYGVPYTEIEQRIKRLDPGGVNPRTGKFEPSHAYCVYFMGQISEAQKYGA